MSYTLYYFNSRGNAEAIRLIFAYAGVEYKDVRYEQEEWPKQKPKMPFGKMPVLELADGKVIPGSMVIARYLGEKYGLAGADAVENAEISGIVDAVVDLVKEGAALFFEEDKDRKEKLLKKFLDTTVPSSLDKFNQLCSKTKDGYLWGSKLTWADLAFYNAFEFVSANQMDKYPALKTLRSLVEQNENIAKWIKERPKTQY